MYLMFDFTIGYFRFYDKNFEKNVYNLFPEYIKNIRIRWKVKNKKSCLSFNLITIIYINDLVSNYIMI